MTPDEKREKETVATLNEKFTTSEKRSPGRPASSAHSDLWYSVALIAMQTLQVRHASELPRVFDLADAFMTAAKGRK